MLDIGHRVSMHFDALERVIEGCDVRQPRQWQGQVDRGQGIERSLQPEIAQGDVGDIENHPDQIERCNQG